MSLHDEEIERIGQLLAHPERGNFLLGMALLRQHPEATPRVLAPILLFRRFAYVEDDPELEQIHAELGVLLTSYVSSKVIAQQQSIFKAFDWMQHYENRRWSEFMQQLQLFEQFAADYESYILSNPEYYVFYYDMARYLKTHYKKPGYAYPFIKKLMDIPSQDAYHKVLFVDIMVNHLFLVGQHLEEVSRVQDTIRDLITIWPSNAPGYYYLLGICSDIYANDKKEAKECYLNCLQHQPQHAGAMNNLANILYKTEGKADEAYELAKKAVDLEENYHYFDTLAYLELHAYGRALEAERLFRRVVKLAPRHHYSQTGLGVALRRQGKLDESRIWMEKALQIQPKSLYKLEQLADLLYTDLAEPQEAKYYYRKILQLDPEHELAKKRLEL